MNAFKAALQGYLASHKGTITSFLLLVGVTFGTAIQADLSEGKPVSVVQATRLTLTVILGLFLAYGKSVLTPKADAPHSPPAPITTGDPAAADPNAPVTAAGMTPADALSLVGKLPPAHQLSLAADVMQKSSDEFKSAALGLTQQGMDRAAILDGHAQIAAQDAKAVANGQGDASTGSSTTTGTQEAQAQHEPPSILA